MQILQRVDNFDRPVAHFVGSPDHRAGWCATSGHQDHHGVRIVSPPVWVHSTAPVIVRRSPEFARADNQRLVEHATLPQVADQRGNRLVDAVYAGRMIPLQEVVAVPAAGEDLHKAHALFHQAPG